MKALSSWLTRHLQDLKCLLIHHYYYSLDLGSSSLEMPAVFCWNSLRRTVFGKCFLNISCMSATVFSSFDSSASSILVTSSASSVSFYSFYYSVCPCSLLSNGLIFHKYIRNQQTSFSSRLRISYNSSLDVPYKFLRWLSPFHCKWNQMLFSIFKISFRISPKFIISFLAN